MTTEHIILNIVIVVVNILMFLNAKRVVTFLNHNEENTKKTNTFKVFNILLLITLVVDIFFQEHASTIIHIGYAIVSVYIGIIAYEILSYYNRIKYGTIRKTEDGKSYDENYNTKINNIFIFIFISSIVVLILLKLSNMESMLEQKGFIGIILAALLFTSSHWLPNIIKGLTIMNSNRLAKGDIIRMNHRFYKIFDMGLQYTRLIDIEANKRVLMENAVFTANKISNVSKKAGLDGYREHIDYNIGYPSMDIKTKKELIKDENKFKSIFKEIFEEILQNREDNKENEDFEDIKVNISSGYELFMIEAGDYALKYRFSFYYQNLAKDSAAKDIRFILSAKHRINEMVQRKAHLRGISLATPVLEQKVGV